MVPKQMALAKGHGSLPLLLVGELLHELCRGGSSYSGSKSLGSGSSSKGNSYSGSRSRGSGSSSKGNSYSGSRSRARGSGSSLGGGSYSGTSSKGTNTLSQGSPLGLGTRSYMSSFEPSNGFVVQSVGETDVVDGVALIVIFTIIVLVTIYT